MTKLGQPKSIATVLANPTLRKQFSIAADYAQQKGDTDKICGSKNTNMLKNHQLARDNLTGAEFECMLDVLETTNYFGKNAVIESWHHQVEKYADVITKHSEVDTLGKAFDLLKQQPEHQRTLNNRTQHNDDFWQAIWGVYTAVVKISVTHDWIQKYQADADVEESLFEYGKFKT